MPITITVFKLCENKNNVVNKLKQVRFLIRKIHLECWDKKEHFGLIPNFLLNT